MGSTNIESVLKLLKIEFNKIEFNRLGFKNCENFKFSIESNIYIKEQKNKDEEASDIYEIILILKGDKPEEYTLEISLSGYFALESDTTLNDELRNELIEKNTVAIMMPYLRAQITILTSQPEVECVVLPPFNINSLFDN